jgi:hypothetical protein
MSSSAEPVSASPPDATLPSSTESVAHGSAARRRPRRVSRTRRFFVGAIQAQITGTRILAAITFLVLAGSAAAWLAGTTGSPVIGVYFIALAAVLTVTVYAFLKLMGTFIRGQS